jgi:TM2 domain-containing membrane protein YozV
MDKETKNIVGLLVNLAIPGLGTIIWGETNKGVIQLVLFFLGVFLSCIIIGIPLVFGVWVWALVKGIQKLSKHKGSK